MIPRLIPVLTLVDGHIYRTTNFSSPSYVGDPINAVRIFNEKGADELVIFDIGDSKFLHDTIKFKDISNITSQAFMPTAYGGGVRNIDDVYKIFDAGFDKVILGSTSIKNSSDFKFVSQVASIFGSQSVSYTLDFIKSRFFGDRVRGFKSSFFKNIDILQFVNNLLDSGIGELIVRDVSCDGKNNGANNNLIKLVSSNCNIPVIATGGIYTFEDVKSSLGAGAHSIASGNMFIYQGKRKAVLINYPKREELDVLFGVK